MKSARRGSGSASRWLTRAGFGEFTRQGSRRPRMMQQAPRAHVARALPAKKGNRSCLFPESRSALLLRAEVGELVAELLDPAAERIDALLGAGIERVRLARR